MEKEPKKGIFKKIIITLIVLFIMWKIPFFHNLLSNILSVIVAIAVFCGGWLTLGLIIYAITPHDDPKDRRCYYGVRSEVARKDSKCETCIERYTCYH